MEDELIDFLINERGLDQAQIDTIVNEKLNYFLLLCVLYLFFREPETLQVLFPKYECF